MCHRVLPLITSMEIIDHRDHNLTCFKTKSKAVNSDHAPLLMEVELKSRPTVKEKVGIPNFNDKLSQLKFKESTSDTAQFTECFECMQPLLEQSNQWLSNVKAHVNKSFKKIRIRPWKIRPSKADRLIAQKYRLQKQGKIYQSELLDAQIAITITEEGRLKGNMFRKYTDRNGSGVLSEMWKLKKNKFSNKASCLPSAKINYKGKVVTEPKELTKLIGEEYGRVRLRKRPSHSLNLQGKSMRNLVLKLKLMKAKQPKTSPFLIKDLEVVLNSLKHRKQEVQRVYQEPFLKLSDRNQPKGINYDNVQQTKMCRANTKFYENGNS